MNHLSALPDEFQELQSLKELFLDGNDFRIFPKQVLSLQNLEWLDFSVNSLESIPDAIFTLSNLKVLNLSYNYYLKFLPESITKLKKLELLDVTRCCDLIIPKSIKSMSNLRIRGLEDWTIDENGDMSIQLLIRDYGSPAVSYYEDEEMIKKGGFTRLDLYRCISGNLTSLQTLNLKY